MSKRNDKWLGTAFLVAAIVGSWIDKPTAPFVATYFGLILLAIYWLNDHDNRQRTERAPAGHEEEKGEGG